MGEVFGIVMLPLFVLLVLFSMAGVKSDVLMKCFFELLGALIKGVLLMVAALVKGIVELVVILQMTGRLSGPKEESREREPEPRRQRIKVTVIDDGEG
jgi:hypothetical protein